MKRIAYLVSFLVLVAATTASVAKTPPAPDVEAYSVSVTIRPSSHDPVQLLDRQSPRSYTCEATILDAAKNTPVAGTARAIVLPGSTEVVNVTSYPWVTTLRVKLAAQSERVNVEVVGKKDGKIMTRQLTTVMLKKADPGIVPLQ